MHSFIHTFVFTPKAKILLASTFIAGAVSIFAFPQQVWSAPTPVITGGGVLTTASFDCADPDLNFAWKIDASGTGGGDTTVFSTNPNQCSTGNYGDFTLNGYGDLSSYAVTDGDIYIYFNDHYPSVPTSIATSDQHIRITVSSGVFLITGFDFGDTEQETGILSLIPSNDEVVDITIPVLIDVTTYIKTEDYDPDAYLRIRYANQYLYSNLQVANKDVLWTYMTDTPLNSLTDYVSTTTTIVDEGRYTLQVQIRKPSFVGSALSFFGLSNLYDAGLVYGTTTTFIASSTTAYDDFIDETASAISTFLSSSTISTEVCSLTGFDLQGCFALMFAWQGDSMQEAFDNIRTGVLTYAPIGYVTRFVEVVTTTGTTTLPTLSYTFADDFPIATLQAKDVTLDVFTDEALDIVQNQLVSTGDEPLNAWDITNDVIGYVLYLWLAFLIVSDLLGLAGVTTSRKVAKMSNYSNNKEK